MLCAFHHMSASLVVGCNLIKGLFKLCDEFKNNNVNSTWLAKKYLNKPRSDPKSEKKKSHLLIL